MERQRGFSLIELLIVVAIILIIAAIAIPSLMRSRMSANEASAVSSVRTVVTAQVAYATAYPTIGYSDTLTKLAHPPAGTPASATAAGLLDWVLGCASQPCPKAGYNFEISNADGDPISSYDVTGAPIVPGRTGVKAYCSSQRMSIQMALDGTPPCDTDLP
jgi:type IV pilus assembly protein PilA